MEKQSTLVLRLVGKVVGTAAGISLIVLLIGYFLGWHEPVRYSNAFFWAGAILVVMGLFSVTGGYEQRGQFGIMYAETATSANIAERNQRLASDMMQRYSSMIFLLLTGGLLIGVAVAIGKILIGR